MQLEKINNVPEKMTEQILVDRYIANIDARERTKDTYRKALKNFVGYMIRNNKNQPVREDILEYKAYLTKNYSNCTVNAYLTAVRCFFAYLETEKIYPNIANGIKGAVTNNRHKKDSLTVDQAKRIIAPQSNSLSELRDSAISALMINTGMRVIEVVRAYVDDITKSGGKTLLFLQGKGRDSKDEYVVLSETVVSAITSYLQARYKSGPGQPLFISHSTKNFGERLTTRSLSRIVKERLKSNGINDSRMTAHSLRHSAVTFALIGGATIQETQQMARHKSINTTMVYAHNIDRLKNAAENKIESLLK